MAARMAALNDRGEVEAAAAEVDQALAALNEEEAQVRARKAALLDVGVEQDVLRRNPASAAARLVAKLRLEVQGVALFGSLRDLQDQWYERGLNLGLNFEAEVAVGLARRSVGIARDADERGAALNDLGVALRTLGERAPDASQLEEAVASYRAALEERTRERVPLDWASTQNNLGTVLWTLGRRAGDTARLEGAVAAYRAALEERTQERVPLLWAGTQINLGTELNSLGERDSGTVRLEEAKVVYRAAMEEQTRERMPVDWAIAQNNLGNVEVDLFDKTGDAAHLDAAGDCLAMAREVFAEAGATQYLAVADVVAARIAERR